MHASRVQKFDEIRRVGNLDHLLNFSAHGLGSVNVFEVGVGVESIWIQIEVLCWLTFEFILAFVGKESKFA